MYFDPLPRESHGLRLSVTNKIYPQLFVIHYSSFIRQSRFVRFIRINGYSLFAISYSLINIDRRGNCYTCKAEMEML